MQQNENASSPINNPGRFHSYLNAAELIVQSYDGNGPFHLFLKKYFSLHKKYGSRDRKVITALCYSCFRAGLAVREDIIFSEKILITFFLCHTTSSNVLASLHPDFNEAIALPFEQKAGLLGNRLKADNFFPFPEELSDQISGDLFARSFLSQPKLFIRIRPGYKSEVLHTLREENIFFEYINDESLAFTNTEKIDQLLDTDKEVVIQDY
ncbi:MAG TPA: hypothetical protein VG847_17140, partial [Chitinophagaceae bacterium]|nr:hypothetical protein [Chitinophagaceae bacterium]